MTLSEPSPPPPQPEAPSTATPASPAPPSFKKSRRLKASLLDTTPRPATVCPLNIFLLFPTAAYYHPHTHARMGVYSCAASIPRNRSGSLTRGEQSSMDESNPPI